MIYLDHNATTNLRPAAAEIMLQTARDFPGNPGSRHAAGRRARQVLESAREQVAMLLQADPREVIFTSGGTESINLALNGLSRLVEQQNLPRVVFSPPGEHPATEQSLVRLEERGWKRIIGAVDQCGRLSPSTLPHETYSLATTLLAHNETGLIRDLSLWSPAAEQRGIRWHVDAVQACGKISICFHDLGCTSLSCAAHKFGGPRGIGALLVRRHTGLPADLVGGHQEGSMRAGTESVALAAGMATALEEAIKELSEGTQRMRMLRDRFEHGLREQCPPVVLNGPETERLPNTVNLAFPGCHGEALLVSLDLAGICCSLGSACASGSLQPSPILVAMGLPNEVVTSSVRFSLGRNTTASEIEQAIQIVAATVQRLRRP